MISEMDSIAKNSILTIDGKECVVKSVVTLHSCVQRNGSKEWTESGQDYKAFYLGGKFLMQLPLKEGGASEWFMCDIQEEGSTLRQYFLGSDENEGPARQFAKSKETKKVEFELFGTKWKMTDIGAFRIETRDSLQEMKDRDLLYYIISLDANGNIFMYLDSRANEAKGIGGSFTGKKFSIETEIESIL